VLSRKLRESLGLENPHSQICSAMNYSI
jgi:hypothetical protein